jgi:hypothetical protein
MRLQDSIASTVEPIRVVLPDSSVFDLPGGDAISGGVRAAQIRYLLDDAVAATTARAAFEDSVQLTKCLDLLRIPASGVWIEWSEAGRRKVMQELGLAQPVEIARITGRAGLLVSASETGRSGCIEIAWDGEFGQPELSPFIIDFDLDNPCFNATHHPEHVTRRLRIDGSDALTALLAHVRYRLRPEWHAYYASACPTMESFERALHQNLAIIAADFPYLSGFCLLLAARNAVASVPVDMTRLNLSRAKRGKGPLLCHVEVKARLAMPPRFSKLDPNQRRLAARMHFVAGHLVRRGQSIHWRRAHIRGNAHLGVVSSRTIVMQRTPAMQRGSA